MLVASRISSVQRDSSCNHDVLSYCKGTSDNTAQEEDEVGESIPSFHTVTLQFSKTGDASLLMVERNLKSHTKQ